MPFDNEALPIRLFTASHKRAWSPGDIDFSQERSDWLALDDDERRLLLRLVSGFRVGERGVTHELAPLQFRFRLDGWIEEELFVAAQMYEEARHVQFFERWLAEALPGRFGVDIPYPDLQGDMFSTRLPRSMRALLRDDSPEALLRAVMLYHFYIEGVAAEAGYTVYHAIFEGSGRFPALERGIRLIQRDEAAAADAASAPIGPVSEPGRGLSALRRRRSRRDSCRLQAGKCSFRCGPRCLPTTLFGQPRRDAAPSGWLPAVEPACSARQSRNGLDPRGRSRRESSD